MPLMHAWHEFTVSVTVLLEALAIATIHEQPFPFPYCCACDLTAPTKGAVTNSDLSARQYTLTQRPVSDSFRNSVHWVLTWRLNGTSACYKTRTNTQIQHRNSTYIQKQNTINRQNENNMAGKQQYKRSTGTETLPKLWKTSDKLINL